MKFDYLIVGGGLFGGVFARQVMDAGKTVLVVEKRPHLGGNIHCRNIEGINVHEYGAHIFHTKRKAVWEYVNNLVEFNHYTNTPMAYYKGEIYNMPFNMNTFHQMWGVVTPAQAKAIIDRQRSVIKGEPQNLEEQAISLVGTDIYQKLVKGYTEKQWGRDCKDLPAFIIRRLPVRYTYNNNYFNDPYQGIPKGGYNVLIEKLFEGAEVITGVDYNENRERFNALADRVLYTGTLDSFYDYCFGKLEYRSLRFETELRDMENYQGVAVCNYTEREVPYTRIIEHKLFEPENENKKTVITREYPATWKEGMEPYYPVNDERNNNLYLKYAEKAVADKKYIFGGRLAEYRYCDMDQVIEDAMKAAEKALKE